MSASLLFAQVLPQLPVLLVCLGGLALAFATWSRWPRPALLAVLGFVMHRLNVSVTGMERGTGVSYFPSWMEIAVSLGLVAAGFALFGLAVRYLPIFEESGHGAKEVEAPAWLVARAPEPVRGPMLAGGRLQPLVQPMEKAGDD